MKVRVISLGSSPPLYLGMVLDVLADNGTAYLVRGEGVHNWFPKERFEVL